MKSFKFNMLALFLILISTASSIYGAGNIKGVVTDSLSNDPLYGANIILVGTALGAASGFQGEFAITNIPAGEYVLRVSYIGYERKEIELNIADGKTVQLDIALAQEIFEGEEVIITAQALGQAAAINQQVNSNTIVNVVSKDKIESLPDANIAESISRLPGIAIKRDAGEGSKVIVRGLSPKFSSITINGQRIPATDPDNRSVDLSMVSQDILDGIEVFKALTPDKDADAIGGTINLVTKSAPNYFRTTVKAQGGYNDLEDDFKQYKFSLNMSDRYFNDKLGILVSGSAQRANRSSDVLDATYLSANNSTEDIYVENLNLADIKETRDRYSAGINFDYKYDNGIIYWNNFYSRTERDQFRRRKRYRVDAKDMEYDSRDRNINTDLITSMLGAEYSFGQWAFDFQGAYSKSKRNIPNEVYSRFRQLSAFTNGVEDDKGAAVIPQYATPDLYSTWFYYGTYGDELVDDRDYTAALNAKYSFNFSNDINGYIKMGVKYRDKKRDRDENEYRTDYGEVDEIGQDNPDKFDLYNNEKILITNFLDDSYDAGNFLDGQYEFGSGLSESLVNDFTNTYRSHYQLNGFANLRDYEAGEKVTAAYLMGVVNLFNNKLMILPGFRYEKTETNYVGRTGELTGNLGETGSIIDTAGGNEYSEFLPMVHVKYNISESVNVRFAFTQSIARPDYFNLVPYTEKNDAEMTLSTGNPDLKHSKSTNYDLYLSWFNKVGLFSIGGFYKDIKNIDYISEYRGTSGEYKNYTITEPVNSEKSKLYGFETEVQANLRFLPTPFNGILISVNYTKLHSETLYPLFYVGDRSTEPPYTPVIVDTFRTGKMPDQAEEILNLTIGYEKGGFSGRASMVFQGDLLDIVGNKASTDGFTDTITRFDISASQKLWNGLSVYANFNNITNNADKSYVKNHLNPAAEEYYGMTIDFGVKYSFEN